MESLNLYQVFYEVAKCQNFSLAAEKLYISQPAISKSISHLEEELQTVLFYRSSRGVKLTAEGELLYQHVGEAMFALKKGESILKSISANGTTTLALGASTTLCKYILLPTLKNFLNEYPNIKLNISCQPTFDTISAFESGRLDIGLVGTSDQPGNSAHKLTYFPLRTIEDIFVSTETYLAGLKKGADGSENNNFLQKSTFILLNKENISRKHVDEFFAAHQIVPSNIMEVNHMDLAIEFAKAGLGIACVISDFVQEELKDGSLVEFKTGQRIPKRKIAFACPSEYADDSNIKNLVQYYKQ